ncbi:MAG TPA: endonuclease/exonuclease/phosphatase family protein, partial [Humisphaera sp.]
MPHALAPIALLAIALSSALLAAPLADAAPAASDAAQPATRPAGLRVMSYNIRYANRGDGDNGWDRRREMLIANIKACDPDLLGLQEVLAAQGDYVKEQLPGYEYVGGGRDDGKRAGEASPVLFRKSRFELVASGQFWLSPTPEQVGSKGWDAALPRIATWAKLTDRATGRAVFFINTHWDHVG